MRYLFLSGAAALCLSSCVGSKNFTVHTIPEGASVTINGKAIPGSTPVTTEIKQDKDLGIVVRKEGYETTSATVKTSTHRLIGFIWTQQDPRARYIEQDEITIPMTKVPTFSNYVPSQMPAFDGRTLPTPVSAPKKGSSAVPGLRPMPAGL